MSAKAVLSPDAPAPLPFLCQAVAFGDLVFCSGQVAIDPQTGTLIQGSISERTVCGQTQDLLSLNMDANSNTHIQKRIILNLSAVLDAAGSSFHNILKVNIYLTNLEDFGEVNNAYTAFFPGLKPASTSRSKLMRLLTLTVFL